MAALLLAPIYLIACFYILHWILEWLSACSYFFGCLPVKCIFSAIYLLGATTLLTSFLIRQPPRLHRALKQISNAWLGVLLYTLLFVAGCDLFHLLIHLSPVSEPSWYTSKGMFVLTGACVLGAILTLNLYGFLNAGKLHTTSYEIFVDKFCPKRKELTVVLIADLHLGYNTREYLLRNMVKKINSLNADLVVIAGDTFDNDFDSIKTPKRYAKILKGIKSTYGTWCCYGNHDLDEPILAGFTFENKKSAGDIRFEKFYRKASIHLLNDETILIDDCFYLAGRRDPDRCKKLLSENGRLTPFQLTRNLDRSIPILVMDHQPSELSELSEAGVDVDLSGHTHAGQMFPCSLPLQFLWENPYGLLKKGAMYSIVTSGAGVWGPNLRIGTKGEICHIHIRFREK